MTIATPSEAVASPTAVSFPQDFLWGTATAAYQVEGAHEAAGRGPSIWDTFARTPGKVHAGHTGDVACDHYHRYREDIALMKRLNLKVYRFSVSWSRVMPDGRSVNPEGLAFYSELVDELLAAGIIPWLTQYHWDLPQALEDAGGWANRDTAYAFQAYAEVLHEALGEKVRHWTTLNEPWCSAFLGYANGHHAPGRTEPSAALAAAHHLLLGHGLAVSSLRARDPELELGLTLNFTDYRPADPSSAGDQDAARRLDGAFNRFFIEPVLRGSYPADVLADQQGLWPTDLVQPGDLEVISAPIDVLGVNFYTGELLTGAEPDQAPAAAAAARAQGQPNPNVGSEHVGSTRRGLPQTAMGWEVYPQALRDLLVRLHTEYTAEAGVALYVTENGAAYEDVVEPDGSVYDPQRLDYIRRHLHAVHEAIEQGADVRGYFVWSLLDNFEWAFGYSKRFGIIHVDYDTQVRTPKASAHWYAEVARSGVVN
ncbi:GH1 family beta-glucosidase [Nesterenkonia alkaliphila]|uniref:Beta-glucosidase n=1 Tax=Nesterenkonia alkaliphila TaxID=1463631 RepID=A0A7K1UMI8_9MICC|nr:GH1 family beta-glucosidase [Nesterenkonia alkaliphila]MVT27687.1 beta-glucosidase [Nesterenkonia alkaliphila]GFZ87876.1 beta-glucosidase [Nesterenkonia alkaliphila]